jgi:hypothetical protein
MPWAYKCTIKQRIHKAEMRRQLNKRPVRKGWGWAGKCIFTETKSIKEKAIKQKTCAGIFKQSMGARNRERIGLSYLPVRLHRLAELIPWNRFLDSLMV